MPSFADSVQGTHCAFVCTFVHSCEIDLEGFVAKRKDSLYRATEKPSPYWIKIKNRNYTQAEVRQELFDPALRTADPDTLRRPVTGAHRG